MLSILTCCVHFELDRLLLLCDLIYTIPPPHPRPQPDNAAMPVSLAGGCCETKELNRRMHGGGGGARFCALCVLKPAPPFQPLACELRVAVFGTGSMLWLCLCFCCLWWAVCFEVRNVHTLTLVHLVMAVLVLCVEKGLPLSVHEDLGVGEPEANW